MQLHKLWKCAPQVLYRLHMSKHTVASKMWQTVRKSKVNWQKWDLLLQKIPMKLTLFYITHVPFVKMLNPMEYVMDEMAQKAHHFRIRHGECDRDTSLVISAMLVLKLREAGCEVDYHSPWNTPHAGDYDLDELFAWIDGICG